MKVAIIGAGLQCRRRAPVVQAWPGAELVAIIADHAGHAEAMTAQYGGEPGTDWKQTVARDDVDVVLVCTPPDLHAPISTAAMRAGKHVLCEKPMTRTVAEAEDMVAVAGETGRILKCGFNHRYHPAISQARKLVGEGFIGKALFSRCRYGICGRPGYEKEWRADPKRAAGGQFLEQGIHAIDLFRWFLGDLVEVSCMTSRHYFTDMPLEDGGMAMFRAANGATASLHTTLVQWQNLFSFEVFGEDGYVRVEGLGASYGTETLVTGKRDFEAPFQDTVTHYRGGDISWREEWREFVSAIERGQQPENGSGEDGLLSMKAALAAYEAEKQGRSLAIDAV
jgi:predicted dehydrogenase